MAEFRPGFGSENEILGSRQFGAEKFAPNITNVTGTYSASGIIQKLGKIVFFAVELVGTSTTASSVFTPPIPPQKIPPAANFGAGEIAHAGICIDGSTVIAMSDSGTYALTNASITNDIRRFSGWYWVN